MSNFHYRKKEACSPPCFTGDMCQSWAWGQQGVLASSISFQRSTHEKWVLSARPRCSQGDVLAWLWTCSNSLNSLSELHFWALKRFSALHLLCIWGSARLAQSRLLRSRCLFRSLSASQMVEMMPMLSTFKGYCSQQPFLQHLSKLRGWKAITSKETSLKNRRKLPLGTFLSGLLCSGLNEWKKNSGYSKCRILIPWEDGIR